MKAGSKIALKVEEALKYVKNLNEDAENFFSGTREKSRLQVPSSVSFIFPSVSWGMPNDWRASTDHLRPYSSSADVLPTNSLDSPVRLGF